MRIQEIKAGEYTEGSPANGGKVYWFDTFSEYLDRADNADYKLNKAKYLREYDAYGNKLVTPRSSYESSWGTPEWSAMMHKAVFGDPSMIKGIDTFANSLIRDIQQRLPVAEHQYELTGASWDLGRVIDNDPECWIHEQPVVDTYREGRGNIVRLSFNTAASYGCYQKSHTNRCGAILALCTLLETCGYLTQIEVVTALYSYDYNTQESKHLEFRTIAKLPSQPLNIAAVAFWGSSYMERHIDFSICETLPELCANGVCHYGGVGQTVDGGDIHFRGMYAGDESVDWNDPESVKAYLVTELAKQGIELNPKKALAA